MLYSDGLIEHRHEHLDAGVCRLSQIARSLDAAGPIDDFCHKLVVEARPSRQDDVALLVLRATPADTRLHRGT